MKFPRFSIRSIAIYLCASGVVVAILSFLRSDSVGAAVALSDAALAVGAVLLGIAFFLRAYCVGFFDAFIFSFSSVFGKLRGERARDYYEFSRRRKRDVSISAPTLLGVLYLLISILLCCVYTVPQA